MILPIQSNNPVLSPVCKSISTVAERIWFWFINIVFISVVLRSNFVLQMALVKHSFQSDLGIMCMCFYRCYPMLATDPVGRSIWTSQQSFGI